mgnify:CR=1 FL=1
MRIIAGTARGTVIDAPLGRDTRPTLDRVRENVFNIFQQQVRGARVLDLFSGSGAMAFEAVSRGAASAVLVDVDKKAHQVEEANCRLLLMDWQAAVSQLQRADDRFNLVFLDPPYAMHDLCGVMNALKPLIAEDAIILVEHEAKTFPSTPDGFDLYDSRKYGIAGVSFFRLIHTEEL